ncbi:MAG: hypothetical protein ACD_4C00467G0002 [uncultured bacterium (gcode 4)]|uniref:DNA 3'-5' helicase n=1 Tax=uncultured bacterium (gcode 4) TaxID=1234023 RepID=K2FT04_9BACT|nr:MAG: hypothetical protein ACD_4C00467G0002 [uncultured bacterium (gcode 4)]
MQDNSKFDKAYDSLNEAQKSAVDTIYGPLMVIAWPGSWKTQIISLRAANIILKTWIDPSNILITTFTEAGIISIKKRLSQIIWSDSYKINVCTIHSFCNDIISTFPEKFLQYRAIRPIDDVEKIEIFEGILDDSEYSLIKSEYDPYFYIRSIIDNIGKLKQEWISPHQFEQIINRQKTDYEEELSEIDPKLKKYENTRLSQEKHIGKLIELNDVYKKYLDILKNKGLYDFVDMIDFVLKALRTDENLRFHYALQYQFIMVDEYQDTNNAQNEIIDLILSAWDDKNIMTVWDDDQSIYRFQWANLENMLHFSKKYEATKFVVLTENYRSTQNILDLALKSISNNKSRISNFIPWISKKLNSNSLEDIEPKFFWYKNDIIEKTAILEKIKELLRLGISEDEIAVILRTNREVEQWTEFFHQNWLWVESKVKSNILKSKYINLILDLVYVCGNPHDDEKLINVARSFLSNIEKVDILCLLKKLNSLNYVRKNKIKLFDLLGSNEYLETIIKDDNEVQQAIFECDIYSDFTKLSNYSAIKDFSSCIINCQKELSVNFYSFFKHVIEIFGVIEIIERDWDFWDLEDLFTFLNLVKSWVEKDKNMNFEKFFKKISYFFKYNLIIPRNIINENNCGIQVLTAHQSKWLEYNTVFVPWLYHGNWGWRRVNELIKLPFWVVWSSISESVVEDSWEEERRLFYVAITRAKKNLFLSMPEWIENKPKLQSEFLQELGLKSEIIWEYDIQSIVKNQFKFNSISNSLSEKEELFLKNFLQNYKFSPSDLNKFLESPLLFLKDTVFKYPFKDNEFTIFWKVYHKTLENFYLEYKKNLLNPWKEFLENNFSRLLAREILSPEESQRLKEKWSNWLSWWFDSKSDIELPVELEYDFRSKNIVFENIPLTWKIDKIELIDDGKVSLVDYKTWKIKTLNEIKWLTQSQDKKYFRQLLFYKLMFSLDSKLSSKYQVESLAIEFVEWKNWKYSTVYLDYTEEDIEILKNEIIESWKKINDINFWKDILK